jgi:hypothetical protein
MDNSLKAPLLTIPHQPSGHKRAVFPAKLHEIVSNPEYEHIISWKPHGRLWEVKDKELLFSVVLKKHFHHSNYESFNRQVNSWGFKVRGIQRNQLL